MTDPDLGVIELLKKTLLCFPARLAHMYPIQGPPSSSPVAS
jgi:hypothetical protein